MKRILKTGAGIALFALSLMAATPTADWESVDRRVVAQAAQKAAQDGKKLLVRVSAAWCAPCAALDEFLDAHRAELKTSLDQYEEVRIEDLYLESNYLTDSLGFEVFDFPNVYLYDPTLSRWSYLAVETDDAASIRKTLDLFAKGESPADAYQTEFRARLQKGDSFGLANDPSSYPILEEALFATAFEKDPADLARFVMEVRQAAQVEPDRFRFDASWGFAEICNRVYAYAISRGVSTVAAVQSVDPSAFQDFSGGSRFYGYVFDFQIQLGRIYRTQGLLTAAERCEALATDANTRYAGEDYNGGGSVAVNRKLACLQLAYLSGAKAKAEVEAEIAAIPESDRRAAAKKLAALEASIGNFADARTAWEMTIQDYYGKRYGSSAKLWPRTQAAYEARKAAFAAGKTHPSAP